uniref:Uncharacterized protein n=1 Tax=Avena sativa TaxID=4498 RepID=A0ACD6A9S5_AVESA
MGYDMNDTSAVLTSCPKSIDSYVRNLTSSYADKSNESSVVATSVFMLVLTAGFFNLNLFSRVSNTSAVLNPTARRLLSSALDIFPAVMSYLLSEAKNAGPGGDSSSSSDLPVRARLILTWMLLVELLRKKVAAILVTPGAGPDQGYGAIISHAATVVWHGYLVFYNIKGAGRVAVFGILWLLGAAKFLQRVAFTEIGKRSLAYGKNARLLSSYMAQMLQARGQVSEPDTPWKRLEMCKYVVMGEENLVVMPGPHGYQLDLARVDDAKSRIVTVGKIWKRLADPDAERSSAAGHRRLFQSNPRIRRLCLSYALFKLLRRRFEHLPAMTKEETDDCRDLVFKGLCSISDSGDDDDNAVSVGGGGGVALFQVLKDEISFLSEYHHSVHPVVLASPYFFLVNYFLFPTVVCGLCLMTILLCGNGDMAVAFGSIMADNYAMSAGVFTMTRCLWQNFLKTPAAFFSTIDISITYLLFLAFIYEEIWEFLVFLFSKWFMVSLLCTYTAKPRSWGLSKTYSGVLHRISYANRKLSHPSRIACKQLSVLSRLSWLSMALGTASLPKQAKSSMTARFRSAAYGGAPLSNGKDILLLGGRQRHDYSHLSWFCESESVAEVILTWHIATCLLELAVVPVNHKAAGGTSSSSSSRPAEDSHRMVATRLSRYCAYLVAFHPELLPDDPEGTERVYKDMKKGLKEALHCWDYHLASESARFRKLMDDEFLPDPDCRDVTMNVVKKGAMLGKALIDEAAKENERSIWKLLDDLWVELIVYVAPSSSDEHMKGHEEALLQGGELVTLLWALATHTGIARPPPTETKVVVTRVEEDLEEGSQQVAVTRVEEDLAA